MNIDNVSFGAIPINEVIRNGINQRINLLIILPILLKLMHITRGICRPFIKHRKSGKFARKQNIFSQYQLPVNG